VALNEISKVTGDLTPEWVDREYQRKLRENPGEIRILERLIGSLGIADSCESAIK
jgi:hypothetical protein